MKISAGPCPGEPTILPEGTTARRHVVLPRSLRSSSELWAVVLPFLVVVSAAAQWPLAVRRGMFAPGMFAPGMFALGMSALGKIK
jgi:hypothetical protein